jgi:bilirubin oxidase
MSYASELPTGVQGGPTMEMGSGPPMDSPINGIDFNLLHFHVTAATPNPVLGVPTNLNTIVPLQEASANITRPITMSAPSMMSMDGPFTFNNLSFDMDVINYHIPLNNIEIWQVSNQTMVAHPFHIHDVPFYILDRDGNLPPMHERGKKDVVLIQSMETVRFITKFETFADSLTPYVYHCHILMHEDAGMMGQFVVMPDATNSVEESDSSTSWGIFPNPTSEILNLILPADCKLVNFQILDASGRIVYTNSNVSASQFDISQLSKGLYYVQITTSSFQSTKKLVVQ